MNRGAWLHRQCQAAPFNEEESGSRILGDTFLLPQDVSAKGNDAGSSIKVFTIAYGSDADVGVLTGIANASGGQEYAGTPQNIKQVYLDISQFF